MTSRRDRTDDPGRKPGLIRLVLAHLVGKRDELNPVFDAAKRPEALHRTTWSLGYGAQPPGPPQNGGPVGPLESNLASHPGDRIDYEPQPLDLTLLRVPMTGSPSATVR